MKQWTFPPFMGRGHHTGGKSLKNIEEVTIYRPEIIFRYSGKTLLENTPLRFNPCTCWFHRPTSEHGRILDVTVTRYPINQFETLAHHFCHSRCTSYLVNRTSQHL